MDSIKITEGDKSGEQYLAEGDNRGEQTIKDEDRTPQEEYTSEGEIILPVGTSDELETDEIPKNKKMKQNVKRWSRFAAMLKKRQNKQKDTDNEKDNEHSKVEKTSFDATPKVEKKSIDAIPKVEKKSIDATPKVEKRSIDATPKVEKKSIDATTKAVETGWAKKKSVDQERVPGSPSEVSVSQPPGVDGEESPE